MSKQKATRPLSSLAITILLYLRGFQRSVGYRFKPTVHTHLRMLYRHYRLLHLVNPLRTIGAARY